mmetsp:Transcript_9318/g.21305  ORF Transcript_9318/g.21305 Transcript_9318/m.21305 type:complete len:333 (+) Transcript_9318:214-1212(+)
MQGTSKKSLTKQYYCYHNSIVLCCAYSSEPSPNGWLMGDVRLCFLSSQPQSSKSVVCRCELSRGDQLAGWLPLLLRRGGGRWLRPKPGVPVRRRIRWCATALVRIESNRIEACLFVCLLASLFVWCFVPKQTGIPCLLRRCFMRWFAALAGARTSTRRDRRRSAGACRGCSRTPATRCRLRWWSSFSQRSRFRSCPGPSTGILPVRSRRWFAGRRRTAERWNERSPESSERRTRHRRFRRCSPNASRLPRRPSAGNPASPRSPPTDPPTTESPLVSRSARNPLSAGGDPPATRGAPKPIGRFPGPAWFLCLARDGRPSAFLAGSRPWWDGQR